MATVKEIKLKKNGAMVSPVVLIDSLKNLDGTKYKDTVTNLLNGYVPTSRTVNGKPLSGNISLSASDVGASASGHNHDDKYFTETEIGNFLKGTATKSVNQTMTFDSYTHSIKINDLSSYGEIYTVTLNVQNFGFDEDNKILAPSGGTTMLLGITCNGRYGSTPLPDISGAEKYIGYGNPLPSGAELITPTGSNLSSYFEGTITLKMIRF